MEKNKSKPLAADKNFVPVSMDDGEELYPNEIFVFNIKKIIEYINEHKNEVPLVSIEVKAYRSTTSKLNESHIDKADITFPLILAEIRPERYNVIDGNHRLEKAYRMGVDPVCAYMLKPEQQIQLLTSLRAYHSYIEYWNSKSSG